MILGGLTQAMRTHLKRKLINGLILTLGAVATTHPLNGSAQSLERTTTRCADSENAATTVLQRRQGVGAVFRCSKPTSNNSTSTAVKQVSFICGMSNNAPVTIAQTQRGDVTVIRWMSGFFSNAGFTPQRRCIEVSSRFQTYYNDGTLKYLTTGRINNQPVICTAKRLGSSCTDVLFTLEPNDNPNQVLRELMNIRSGATSTPLSRGGASQKQTYINLDAYLNQAPVEPEVVPVSPSQPNF